MTNVCYWLRSKEEKTTFFFIAFCLFVQKLSSLRKCHHSILILLKHKKSFYIKPIFLRNHKKFLSFHFHLSEGKIFDFFFLFKLKFTMVILSFKIRYLLFGGIEQLMKILNRRVEKKCWDDLKLFPRILDSFWCFFELWHLLTSFKFF
jgi:hypothetical protein